MEVGSKTTNLGAGRGAIWSSLLKCNGLANLCIESSPSGANQDPTVRIFVKTKSAACGTVAFDISWPNIPLVRR
jgi:hypothetical protein